MSSPFLGEQNSLNYPNDQNESPYWPGRYPAGMAQPSDFEARLTAPEARVGELAADTRTAREDAVAARHLVAARDRDIADLAVKVEPVSYQCARRADAGAVRRVDRRFDAVDRRFESVDRRFEELERKEDNGFTEMRGKFDATAAGLNQITGLLTTLIDQQGNQPGNAQD